MEVVDNLLRNLLISLSSFDESMSLSLSVELINDTIVTTSFVLGSTEFFLCSALFLSLYVLELSVKKRLFVFLDFFFRDADFIDRSICDI